MASFSYKQRLMGIVVPPQQIVTTQKRLPFSCIEDIIERIKVKGNFRLGKTTFRTCSSAHYISTSLQYLPFLLLEPTGGVGGPHPLFFSVVFKCPVCCAAIKSRSQRRQEEEEGGAGLWRFVESRVEQARAQLLPIRLC